MSQLTTHPNWALLVADRDASGEDPADWQTALDHMDTCDDCRKQALAADPTLVFRHLPPVTVDAAEVDSMRAAVASLRQASRSLDVADSVPPSEPSFVRGAGDQARRVAAALVLAAAGLGVWFAAGEAEDPVATTALPAITAPAVAAGLPVYEGLSRPHEPDVYQLGGDDLTVVMVVDETLDI
ncbi:MAG TPA: hypothetical protein VKU40_16640 [Thermoanaerobaculia bacterium]|nr:hypothetical protein [Thermoanaerobaculia bacterium]